MAGLGVFFWMYHDLMHVILACPNGNKNDPCHLVADKSGSALAGFRKEPPDRLEWVDKSPGTWFSSTQSIDEPGMANEPKSKSQRPFRSESNGSARFGMFGAGRLLMV